MSIALILFLSSFAIGVGLAWFALSKNSVELLIVSGMTLVFSLMCLMQILYAGRGY